MDPPQKCDPGKWRTVGYLCTVGAHIQNLSPIYPRWPEYGVDKVENCKIVDVATVPGQRIFDGPTVNVYNFFLLAGKAFALSFPKYLLRRQIIDCTT